MFPNIQLASPDGQRTCVLLASFDLMAKKLRNSVEVLQLRGKPLGHGVRNGAVNFKPSGLSSVPGPHDAGRHMCHCIQRAIRALGESGRRSFAPEMSCSGASTGDEGETRLACHRSTDDPRRPASPSEMRPLLDRRGCGCRIYEIEQLVRVDGFHDVQFAADRTRAHPVLVMRVRRHCDDAGVP